MRFLDAVDRRDGSDVASLFHPDAIWSTASPFGEIQGAANIEAFINTTLPPRSFGPGYARHKMASAADTDDLTVVTPTGERCQFNIETEGNRVKMKIKKLVREIL
jgi:NADH-quinone oxidoreductase subunit G